MIKTKATKKRAAKVSKPRWTMTLEEMKYHPDRFGTPKDGWVRDKFTGKDWYLKSFYGSHSERKKACESVAGMLPTFDDAESLVDRRTKNTPALIRPDLFKDTHTEGWYATSTEVPGDPVFVRIVDYSDRQRGLRS